MARRACDEVKKYTWPEVSREWSRLYHQD